MQIKRVLEEAGIHFWEFTSSILGAAILACVILIALCLIVPKAWVYCFAILLAYLFADIFMFSLIKKDSEMIQIPFRDKIKTSQRGHGYLIFLIAIVISAVISGFLASLITSWTVGIGNKFIEALILNAIIVVLVVLDFEFGFSKK